MSQEKVERVLGGYDAVNRGDLEAAVQGLSPDCELMLPPMLPEADAYQGREGLRSLWERWRDDQVVHVQALPTRAEALEAVGLDSEA